MKKTSQLTSLLYVDYPVVQGPMLGVSTPEMAAAVSNAGGLGSLPVGGLSPERTLELIQLTRQKTGKPFAVNVFAHDTDIKADEQAFEAMQEFLEKFCSDHHIPFERRQLSQLRFYSYHNQIEILLQENIPVVSFTFGMLDEDTIAKFKINGTLLIGTATSVAEAVMLDEAGVDVITAQGFEAGGHRGSFLKDDDLPQVGLFSLLPQVVDAVNVPVLAAGGVVDKRSITAALALGAAGVQLGSVFIVADESLASEEYKQVLLRSTDTTTRLTRALSGRWARGIRNELMEAIEQSGLQIPYYTFQNALTASLQTYEQKNGLKDYTRLWAGQSAAKAKRGSTADIFKSLVNSVDFNGITAV